MGGQACLGLMACSRVERKALFLPGIAVSWAWWLRRKRLQLYGLFQHLGSLNITRDRGPGPPPHYPLQDAVPVCVPLGIEITQFCGLNREG